MLAGLGVAQGRLTADQAAADHQDVFARQVLSGEGRDAVHDVLALDARDLRHDGGCAHGQDHRIGLMIQDRLGVQLGPQLDLYIQLLQLALIPLVQLVQLFLKVVGPGGNEIAAQLVARLAEGDLVAPQRRTAGGLHPGHAAADH